MKINALIKILRRFPKDATVTINQIGEPQIDAFVDEQGRWTVNINGIVVIEQEPEEQIDISKVFTPEKN